MAAIQGWEMVSPGEPLRPTTREVPPLAPGDVLVRVAGCGVCHTDLGFLYDGVRTRHALPLILGHEISGVVEDAGADHLALIGTNVVVPAVIPCGTCRWCTSGQGTLCPKQIMPGNDVDGGFASHVVVPGRYLCPVPGSGDFDAPIGPTRLTLRELAVVADAVTTPYQAVERSGLTDGDVAVIVGVGGIGGYAAQLAKLRGALVVGIDTDPAKLEAAASRGVSLAIDPRGQSNRDVRAHLRQVAKDAGCSDRGWKIFECSGTRPGQQLAFDLLGYGATLLVVGFSPQPVEVRLSNLMAFDARAIGNWGCDPSHYPAVVRLVTQGLIDVSSHVEVRPLGRIVETFEQLHTHGASKRFVLAPEAA